MGRACVYQILNHAKTNQKTLKKDWTATCIFRLWGYLIILIVMALIAAVMLAYFRNKKWL